MGGGSNEPTVVTVVHLPSHIVTLLKAGAVGQSGGNHRGGEGYLAAPHRVVVATAEGAHASHIAAAGGKVTQGGAVAAHSDALPLAGVAQAVLHLEVGDRHMAPTQHGTGGADVAEGKAAHGTAAVVDAHLDLLDIDIVATILGEDDAIAGAGVAVEVEDIVFCRGGELHGVQPLQLATVGSTHTHHEVVVVGVIG